MRALRILAKVLGGVVVLVGLLFAFLQTPPGQRTLVGLVSDKTLQMSGLSGFFPTDLQVARIELLDEQGAWLRVENARLRWSFASLFEGRVRVEMLSAALVDILRSPLPQKTTEADGGGGSFKLPVGVDLQALSLDTLHLAAPLAGVESRWTLHGNGLLSADLHEGRLRLAGDRTDGPSGKLAVDTRFDLVQRTVDNGPISPASPCASSPRVTPPPAAASSLYPRATPLPPRAVRTGSRAVPRPRFRFASRRRASSCPTAGRSRSPPRRRWMTRRRP
jgi:translocation and assembly module TamB